MPLLLALAAAPAAGVLAMPLLLAPAAGAAGAAGANTLADFGYYYAVDCPANTSAPCVLPPVVAAHSTTTFLGAQQVGLAGLRAANVTAVVSCEGLFLNGTTRLADNWQQNWASYWASAAPHAASISAFYPVDEPAPALISSGAYGTIVKAIKRSAPHIPIAAVVTPSAVRGIEFGAFELPPEVDWLGGDDYGCWAEQECEQLGECCWMNRTMPHNLGVLRDYASKRGGKVVVVPDGVGFPTLEQRKHGEKALPSPAQQAVRASRDRKYYEWCRDEELCVAMWVFLWRSVHTATGWLTGVEDQREVLLPALVEMGQAIKGNRSVSPPVWKSQGTAANCWAVLAASCSVNRTRAHSQSCEVCAGRLQHALRKAGCSDGDIEQFCKDDDDDDSAECVITAHGAVPDNETVNTAAIQSAIDACHAAHPRGSRVVVPAGAFKTGSIALRSNMELHLAKGAGLYGSSDWSEYPIVPGLPFGTMFRALISGYNLTNVSVTGSNDAVPGSDSIIDGVGWTWWCIARHQPIPAKYCPAFNP